MPGFACHHGLPPCFPLAHSSCGLAKIPGKSPAHLTPDFSTGPACSGAKFHQVQAHEKKGPTKKLGISAESGPGISSSQNFSPAGSGVEQAGFQQIPHSQHNSRQDFRHPAASSVKPHKTCENPGIFNDQGPSKPGRLCSRLQLHQVRKGLHHSGTFS